MNDFSYEMLSDPHAYKVGALPSHSGHITFFDLEEMRCMKTVFKDSLQKAIRGIRPELPLDMGSLSSMRMSLNGVWQFHYAGSVRETIPGFFEEDFDASAWEEIQVPSHMELEGFGRPQYLKAGYPWDGREALEQGEAPVYGNPSGSYIRDVCIPERWKGNRVFISFQGVESALALWLNGNFIGFCEDSYTPSEFELTPFLKDGWNRIAAMVFGRTGGSWFEAHDGIRLSGIFRDVFLYTAPLLHIFDLRIEATPGPNLVNGNLSVKADFHVPFPGEESSGLLNRYAGTLRLTLYKDREEILDMSVPIREKTIIKRTIENPALWSAENPALYDLVLQVQDPLGRTVEVTSERVGFRRFEIRNGLMCLNGKRIVFKGVNRREWNAQKGRVPDFFDAVSDAVLMKKNNINAIRTGGYPSSPYIYYLCDVLGIYVVGENNLRTRGSGDFGLSENEKQGDVLPGSRVEYLPMLLERADSVCRFLRNHPSVLIWSVGSEAFDGYVIGELSRRFKTHDRTRLVHYEFTGGACFRPEVSDMLSLRFPSEETIRETLAKYPDRPLICCAMSRSLGNANGDLLSYTNLTKTHIRFQGGFIADWNDQALLKKDRFGNEYLAFGGDFGDRPHDGHRCGSGLVDALRRPFGKLAEVRQLYRNMDIEVGTVSFSIFNRNLFLGSSCFRCHVLVEREGVLCEEAVVETDVGPLERGVFAIPFSYQKEPGEYVITVSLRLKRSCLWAEEGFEAAFGQAAYLINGNENRRLSALIGRRPAVRSKLRVIRGGSSVGVSGRHFEALFSLEKGELVSYRVGSREYLADAPRPNFWRAPTDSDREKHIPERLSGWKIASLYSRPFPGEEGFPRIQENGEYFEIAFLKKLPPFPEARLLITYLVFEDGRVRILLDMEAGSGLPPIPEYGLLFKLDPAFDRISWYGLGPDENYSDRNTGVRLGVHCRRVRENMEHYLKPQECGNRTGVRWVKAEDAAGRGLCFSIAGWRSGSQTLTSINSVNPLAADAMQFSALPYSPEMLEEAGHENELPPPFSIHLLASLSRMGAGAYEEDAFFVPGSFLSTERPLHFELEFCEMRLGYFNELTY
ncbi:MAG: DUF4981 domain-containing protein [Lachnospiraceae bacterium]|nr:DUF4981 domain-containing protein [Lachnospiraceae bacterium]